MSIIEIEFKFERNKRRILARIASLKDEWQKLWDQCSGNHSAEAKALETNLRIQLMETEALADLKELEAEIEQAKNRELEID